MGGFGGGPFGLGGFGLGGGTFDLTSAVAANDHVVDLTFSAAVNPGLALTTSVGAYTVTGPLLVLGVVVTGANTVRLYTGTQSAGAVYTVTVSTSLTDMGGQYIAQHVASFTGLGPADKYVVSDLAASSLCEGRRVRLAWTNPNGAQHVKIVRRTRSWPYDLTDPADVIYDGAAITSFEDSGATLARPNALLEPQTYYYYLVLVSSLLAPTNADYDISDASRDYALSIDVFNSSQFFLANTPAYMKQLDALPVSEGGGAGFLAKWYAVMGCWLDLMRGYANAVALLADDDKAPYDSLTAKNYEMGITPEGASYDFSIARRSLLSLAYIYKRKGSCPGIVEAVRMFTLWDASCVELGDPGGCVHGPTAATTWDGVSEVFTETLSDGDLRDWVYEADGRALATYILTVTPGDHELMDGKLIGDVGDIACIEDNYQPDWFPDPLLYTKAVEMVTHLSIAASAGDTTLNLVSTSGLYPGMTIQVTNNIGVPTGGPPGPEFSYAAEIVEVYSVTPGVSVSLRYPLLHTYSPGAGVSIQKSLMRFEYTGTATARPTVHSLTEAKARWVENQWAGYKVLPNDNVERTVISNTGTTLVCDGAALPAAPFDFAIASGFTVAGSWAARGALSTYKMTNGSHATFLEPTYDLEERYTLTDPFNRLWMGPGASILGVWGPADLGVYITTPVTVIQGRASVVSGAVFDLDTTQSAPSVNALVGMYLNPNQNQEQLFEIVSNTTTTVTVAATISSLVVPGQAYYVLKLRDRNKFQRITARLKTEFTHTDVRPHVLFV